MEWSRDVRAAVLTGPAGRARTGTLAARAGGVNARRGGLRGASGGARKRPGGG